MEENRISARQLRRMLFIEIFGIGALSVPALACYNGQSGFWSTVFYGILFAGVTIYFFIISEKNVLRNYADTLSQKIRIVYMIRFFINVTMLFYFWGKTIQTVSMPQSGFLFILFPASLLLWYSMRTDLQKRARFLELIFPWIVTVYFLAVLLSFLGTESFTQIGNEGEMWSNLSSDSIIQSIQNGYFLLLCSSPIEFLLFLKPATVEKFSRQQSSFFRKNKAIISIVIVVTGSFLCNSILIFLAVRTLGKTLTAQCSWPVIKMMQLVRLPGGFLARFDILPAVLWMLCMAGVLSGYLYYGQNIFESFINEKKKKRHIGRYKFWEQNVWIITGGVMIILLFLACFVEKQPFLWTGYLKYKMFVDFPLALILPLYPVIMNHEQKKKGISGVGITRLFLLLFPVIFLLTGCQQLTDVEEKSYILSLYVDYPADRGSYCFWAARADLDKMDERDEEIPCQITKIEAKNLQEFEQKYLETIPGEMEWNHVYTIFLGPGIAMDKRACIQLMKEWDDAWQKSPNVLLALCSELPQKLYKVKNIPKGAAGQEANRLAEQNKKQVLKNICETPIDYLRFQEKNEEKIPLYRITIEGEKIILGKGAI